jgi:hypothetical protein
MRTRSAGEWVGGIVVGLTLALGLTTAAAARGQPAAAQGAASKPSTAAKAEGQPQGGMGEGIKVHGHWTIDIKNQDGTLASQMEFENSLVPGSGNQALSALLGGASAVVTVATELRDSHYVIGGASSVTTPCPGRAEACRNRSDPPGQRQIHLLLIA